MNYIKLAEISPTILGIFLALAVGLLSYRIQSWNTRLVSFADDAITELDNILERYEVNKNSKPEVKAKHPEYSIKIDLTKARSRQELSIIKKLLHELSFNSFLLEAIHEKYTKVEENKELDIQCFKIYIWIALGLITINAILIVFGNQLSNCPATFHYTYISFFTIIVIYLILFINHLLGSIEKYA